jgi:hypothetical protein
VTPKSRPKQKKLLKLRKFTVLSVAVFLFLSIISNNYAFSETNALKSQATSISASGLVQISVGNVTMWLHANSTKILNSNNEEVIWNGIDSRGLFGYWIYPEEEFINASDVQIIRNYGLNDIRVMIAMDMAVRDQPMGTPTQLNYNPHFWSLLDEIVKAAEQNGVWVSIAFGPTDGTWANIGGFWGDGTGFPQWMYNGSWPYLNKIYTNDATGRSDAIRDFWNLDDPTAANVRQAFQTFWSDIATRYKDSPNVIFSIFNEPMNKWGGPELWTTDAEWAHAAQMYQTFIEQSIDVIRNQDGDEHLIIVNEAYLQNGFAANLQIRRPNVVIENHAYWIGSNMTSNVQGYAQLAWRYNQPFVLGEFGGVEQGLQDRTSAIATMQACNQLNVGWTYLWYNPTTSADGIAPSIQTWTDIQNNLQPNLKY